MFVVGLMLALVLYGALSLAAVFAESTAGEWVLVTGWTITTCALIGLGVWLAVGDAL